MASEKKSKTFSRGIFYAKVLDEKMLKYLDCWRKSSHQIT
jgi:hypothetical protein